MSPSREPNYRNVVDPGEMNMLAREHSRSSSVTLPVLLIALFCPFAHRAHAGQVPYSGCGQLVSLDGFPPCVIFYGMDGATLYPSSLGGLRQGDQACVSGEINTSSAIICNGNPYFILNVTQIQQFVS